MTLRKIPGSINATTPLAMLALSAALALSACTYHDGHHRGHHRGPGVERDHHGRDHDRRVCCKRGRRDWWANSRRACHRQGGEVVSRRYCRRR